VSQTLEYLFGRAFRDGDAAYLHRGCSAKLLHALHARGHVVFLEQVNTMDRMSGRIIDDAFARAGWPIEPSYVEEPSSRKLAQADAADFTFSPSTAVTQSLLEYRIPRERILECSNGWDPERFNTTARALPQIDGVTVLFVGSISIRKGAHLLLSAWDKAGIRGRLVLLGHMEPLIARHCASYLQRHDVIHLAYNPDPASVYRSADVFAFPTLEEGGPLVTYEAMGCGLPILTSPMGSAGVVVDGEHGRVVDPHESEQLIDALRQLSADAELRRTMGEAGRARAAEFTWDKVAQRRYELIRKALA
jgi:glycosyltransferase involved in cell wall biosynthesis